VLRKTGIFAVTTGKISRLLSLVLVVVIASTTYLAFASSMPTRASGMLAATQAVCNPEPCQFAKLPQPKLTKFDEAAVAKIDLEKYPIVPEINDYVKAIYEEGKQHGLNTRIFSKVGDCMTATPDFLEPIGKGEYTLGKYASLQKVIDHYSGVPARDKDFKLDSFANPGLAATSGFNAAGVLEPIWSDPSWCKNTESPLACEYRVSKPSIALIMFGTNDLKSITADQFEFYLRRVVVETHNAGIIPVLSTFPVQPDFVDNSLLYNKITAKIATEYNVPLINLWLALKPLKHGGVDPANTTHMTKPTSGRSASFEEADLESGYNVRNLVTLRTLESILKVIAPDAVK
jgi:hypothetical protein